MHCNALNTSTARKYSALFTNSTAGSQAAISQPFLLFFDRSIVEYIFELTPKIVTYNCHVSECRGLPQPWEPLSSKGLWPTPVPPLGCLCQGRLTGPRPAPAPPWVPSPHLRGHKDPQGSQEVAVQPVLGSTSALLLPQQSK